MAFDNAGKELYLSLLSDWDLDAAFLSSSDPCLRLKVDLKPFEEGTELFFFQRVNSISKMLKNVYPAQ